MAQQLGHDRRGALRRTTSSRPRTSSPRTGRRSASSAGRSRAATRPRRSRPRSPGLVAAADLARANGDTTSAAIWLGVADDWQRSIKGWTVTTNGPLAPRYFIRLSKAGDPNAAIILQRRQRRADARPALGDRRRLPRAGAARRAARERPGRRRVAAGRGLDDPLDTPSGPGWHRYNGDGYGDRASDGRPWAPSGQGTGHLWPVLSAERGEQSLATGDAAGGRVAARRDERVRLRRRARSPSRTGRRPTSRPRRTAPIRRSPRSASGTAAPPGSASPLTWSAASFVRLAADLDAGRNVAAPGGHDRALRRRTRRPRRR